MSEALVGIDLFLVASHQPIEIYFKDNKGKIILRKINGINVDNKVPTKKIVDDIRIIL